MNPDILKEVLYYKSLSPDVMLLILGAAFFLGAIHALGPGHGKSIMAAYLVGSQGRIKDAFLLGISLTISHVFSVIITGIFALLVSNFYATSEVTIWLSLLSGIGIIGIGAWLFITRLRFLKYGNANTVKQEPGTSTQNPQNSDHKTLQPNVKIKMKKCHRDHSHYNPSLSFRSNIALGMAGGIIPCPKAIVILLLAISLQKIALGLIIILVFSLGLAIVLVSVGIVILKASFLTERWFKDKWIKLLPVAGSLVIITLGLFLTIHTLPLI